MKIKKERELIFRFSFLPVVLIICSFSFAQYPEWTVYLPNNNIYSIAIDSSGNKWIGTQIGLMKFDGSKWTVYNMDNSGLSNYNIYSIAIDSNGTKWIGTLWGGLAKFDGSKWKVYDTANSDLPSNSVHSIVIDGSGTKWIGTNGGLAKFDGTAWTVYNDSNSGLPANAVSSIVIDGSGTKWIGAYTVEIFYQPNPPNGLSPVYYVSGGLAKFDSTTWTAYNIVNSGLPNNEVTSIAIDGGGNKWVGTSDNGLTKFDGSKWTVYNNTNSGLPDNNIQSIAIDSGGTKWIGTNGGLAKFDGTTWTIYNYTNSGLPNNSILSIAIDRDGNKWIGTVYGLAVFSGGNSAIKINHGLALNNLTPLCSNYPNPFKQRTLINYNVLENGPVSLRIYSLDGHLVQTLVNAKQTTGHYTASWDGKNDKGKIMAHGVYLYRLTSSGGIISKKMNFVE
jgi:Predicted periplasmic ligand-binding sensor domain